ncbi:MAG: YqhG/Tai3 family protein [Gemmatimonadales bacterium]
MAPSIVATPRLDYAERPVREFLKLHFAGSREFTARGLDRKERFLTRRFRSGLYRFFGRTVGTDSAPPLVTDPFTGSQGATTFAVGDARVRVEKARVPVQFSDGENEWTLTYLLRNDLERNDERWYIDDIEDRRGMLLSRVLRK